MTRANSSPRRIQAVLGERSFRNLCGYTLFTLVVILPSVDAWKYGSETETNTSPMASTSTFGSSRTNSFSRFGAPAFRSDFPSRIPQRQSVESSGTSWIWFLGRPILGMMGATLSLMILMPFSGCKRWALLFGPPTGLATVMAISLWLWGRSEIYRWEPIVIGVLAALPTATLWFFCCKWAFEGRSASTHFPNEIVNAEVVN